MKALRALTLGLGLLLASATVQPAAAQCPMCKQNVQAHLSQKGRVGAGLNTGILYLLAIPYAMVGTVAYLWWRRQRRVAAQA